MNPLTLARIALCLLAALILFLLALQAIDTDVLRWEWAALGFLALGSAPWDRGTRHVA
ncbi:MAG TPA: hypothetical protein VGN59_06995 [Acidimicrobiia bacterium]